MIVHSTPTGWQIIYQRAHALLAAQLAAAWRADDRPPRWTETLAAITQHDDGGREWEGSNLLTPAGAPKDFKIGNISLEQPATSVMHARYQGQYIALLQSMHMTTLYRDFKDDPTIVEFVQQQDDDQKRFRRALKMTKADAERYYTYLYWADSFSLILCQRHLPTDGRAIEIGSMSDGTITMARRVMDAGGSDPRSGGEVVTLTVEPWPFEAREFEVSIEATSIEGMTFESDEALVKAMQNGEIAPLVWRLVKG